MQRLVIGLLALIVLLQVGCSIPRPRARNTLPDDPWLGSLERGQLLLDQGDNSAAAVQFRNIIACTEDHWEREEARIGAAKAMIRMHRLAAAMAALGTLPAAPQTEYDCRKLAIAGEIMLRQRRTEEAETCLELALDACELEAFVPQMDATWSYSRHGGTNGAAPIAQASFQAPADSGQGDQSLEMIPPGAPVVEHTPDMPVPESTGPHGQLVSPMHLGAVPPPWLPACCANLGCAYLKNDKPEKAAAMYEFASHLSRQSGDHIAAERAQRVCDDLNSVLRQYAPYKPHPITQRFPPGRY